MNVNQEIIYGLMEKMYPHVKCALNYNAIHELVVAVILSAQCTDKRVNIVTKKLFSECKTLKDFRDIPIHELEKLIFQTGFYRNKAKNIQALAGIVINKYHGEIPKKMEDLVSLPGVGRKTANVIQQEAFGIVEGVVTDTHVIRLSYVLGYTKKKLGPEKLEIHLMKILDRKYWFYYSHYLILLGRSYCKARRPNCGECYLKKICLRNGV